MLLVVSNVFYSNPTDYRKHKQKHETCNTRLRHERTLDCKSGPEAVVTLLLSNKNPLSAAVPNGKIMNVHCTTWNLIGSYRAYVGTVFVYFVFCILSTLRTRLCTRFVYTL